MKQRFEFRLAQLNLKIQFFIRKGYFKTEINPALTIAALTLPVSLFMSSYAYAESTHPQTSSGGKVFKKVHFGEFKDLGRLVKSFPFLKERIQGVAEENQMFPDKPTRVFISAFADEGGNRLFFLSLSGALECGSGGCSLTVYRVEAKDYKIVLDALAGGGTDPVPVIHVSADATSLVTCSPKGRTEWLFKNKSFNHPGPYTGSQKLEDGCD